jgi:hypothetical protein
MAVAHKTETLPAMSAESQTALVKQYCAGCHSEKGRAGQLSLTGFDAAHVDQHADVAEKMIRKLRAGMMPPPGARRPEGDALTELVSAIETKVDTAAALHPNPGRRTFQRLNRAEYARSIKELLDVDVDVNAFLPPDTMSAGFDNIADVQGVSPTLLEGYLRAASRISSLALGDRSASASEATYKVPRTQSQMKHIDGTPWGTRGGISVVHTFPADGEYTFRVMLHGTPTGQLFGSVSSREEQLEISINGERAALIDVDYRISETDKNGLNLTTPRIHVKAGPQHLAAAFIQKFDGVIDDLVAPIDYTLADTEYGDNVGMTALPHVRDFSITGPHTVTGVSDTPSRRRIFVCRPLSAAEEIPCARRIVGELATQAYRHSASNEDIADAVLRRGAQRQGLRSRYQIRAAGDARQPPLHLPSRGDAAWREAGPELPGHRRRSRVPPVVLHLGDCARRRTVEGCGQRHAQHAGRAREAGAPHACRSARGSDVDAVRVAVAPSAGCRENSSGRAVVPVVRQ